MQLGVGGVCEGEGVAMDLCSEGHPEICFTARECPLCKVRRELREELDEARREAREAAVQAAEAKETVDG